MANYNNTILKTDNPEIYKTVIGYFKKYDNEWHYGPHELAVIVFGDNEKYAPNFDQLPPEAKEAYFKGITEIVISTRNDGFVGEAIELSKQFPNDKIICEHAYEGDWYFNKTIVEYSGGKDTIIKEFNSPSMFSHEPQFKNELGINRSREVINRIKKFVTELYDKNMISKGETITYQFIYKDNWKIIAVIPYGPMVETEIFKAKRTNKTEWLKVEPGDIDLPF